MKFKVSEIYEIAPISIGDKIHTKSRKELKEFYTDEELDKIADRDFIVDGTSNDIVSVEGLLMCLIHDDIAYIER